MHTGKKLIFEQNEKEKHEKEKQPNLESKLSFKFFIEIVSL